MIYTIQKSNRINKKYRVIFKDGRKDIYFGDSRYPQFRDVALGLYKHLNHNDKKRRDLYYARHGRYAEKWSSKWFSHKYLWPM